MRLRRAAYAARHATVRRRSLWVLLIAGGLTVGRLARLAGVSRPTVYRYLEIWLATGDPAALGSIGSGHRHRKAVGRLRGGSEEGDGRVEVDH